MDRRNFLNRTLAATAALSLVPQMNVSGKDRKNYPLVLATWNHGLPASEEAMKILQKGDRALDAVEAGICKVEADPNVKSVGYGGLPDSNGVVTLDACIMDELGNAGAVSFLQNIMHPISVARKVMENSPHVMLSGEGALNFALENGFKKENLLTEEAKRAWREWKLNSGKEPFADAGNHDTVAVLALDKNGNISGGCSTSGLAFKMHGRVGDSPIIGAGLYCDNEVGGAAATGHGELVMKMLGSFLIVEMMRFCYSPQEACFEAVKRIVKMNPKLKDSQVGFIAMNKAGETGAYSLREGFRYAMTTASSSGTSQSDFFLR